MACSEPQPFDPDDLARRLNIVLAEQHLQELQLGKRLQDQDAEWLKFGRRLNFRGRKNPAPTKEAQSQLDLEKQGHDPSKGEQRKSVKWAFRTKPAYPARQSDEGCALSASAIPPPAYTTFERAAAIRHAHSQRDMRQGHDDAHQTDSHTMVLGVKSIHDSGRGRIGDSEGDYPPDWAQTGATDSKPRGLQLLKRMSSISALKAKKGNEPRVVHEERVASRTHIDPIPEETPPAQRKSGLLLKLRR